MEFSGTVPLRTFTKKEIDNYFEKMYNKKVEEPIIYMPYNIFKDWKKRGII